MITALHEAGVRVAVAHLDDQAAYEFCRAAGADLFQGEFFCHPKTITGRGVPTNRLAQLELLAAVENPACELEDLDAVISRDLSLSYRLLRWINSAYFSLPRTVTSVREAVVLLGLRAVRNWATLITLANIDDQPSELVRTAMTRAKMAELVALGLGERDTEAYFTVGLFSALDALMNARMEDVLDSLPLGEDVRSALLRREGPMGDALSWVMAYERGPLRVAGRPVARRRDAARRLPAGDRLGRRDLLGRAARRVVRPRRAGYCSAESSSSANRSSPPSLPTRAIGSSSRA